ncbi:hypothetical protein AB4Z46_28500 [Variovorax sp. M-6]|uniref:hypothetical protein n=1 Tax=Variovorax sp. M-6 TaxID=3233041 RepID=UPI003F96754A
MTSPKSIVASPDLKQNQIVRRYLDLPKFLDLLRSQSLYLRRADGFTDRFEGALTPAVRAAVDEAHREGQIHYGADEFYQRARQSNFVSCWNLGAKDNMALWQLYGGVANSVVVTSTIDKLLAPALRWNDVALLHKVRYIDHFKNPDMVVGDGTDLLQFKHEAYKFENEVRIVVPRSGTWKSNPAGIRLPLGDLNEVIRSVVVAPEAAEWFFELVEDVTQKYGVSSPVRRSKLTELPR